MSWSFFFGQALTLPAAATADIAHVNVQLNARHTNHCATVRFQHLVVCGTWKKSVVASVHVFQGLQRAILPYSKSGMQSSSLLQCGFQNSSGSQYSSSKNNPLLSWVSEVSLPLLYQCGHHHAGIVIFVIVPSF